MEGLGARAGQSEKLGAAQEAALRQEVMNRLKQMMAAGGGASAWMEALPEDVRARVETLRGFQEDHDVHKEAYRKEKAVSSRSPAPHSHPTRHHTIHAYAAQALFQNG